MWREFCLGGVQSRKREKWREFCLVCGRYRVEKGKNGVSFEISNKGRPPQDLRWGPYAVVEREHSTILCLSGMNVLYIFCKDAI